MYLEYEWTVSMYILVEHMYAYSRVRNPGKYEFLSNKKALFKTC